MKIAILGWGSLLHTPGELAMQGEWEDAGLALPIEFSRVSSNGRLTLVIDEEHGVPVGVSFVLSSKPTLREAIENLRIREGKTLTGHIGFVDCQADAEAKEARRLHPDSTDRIKNWVSEQKLDAAIWTGLPANFQERRGVAFSVEAARDYVLGLDGEKRNSALDYIRHAPDRVVTPVRTAVEAALQQG